MRNTTWMPTLSALGVALLVTSCAGDASAADDEPEPTASASASADVEGANAEDQEQPEAGEAEETAIYEPEFGMVYTRTDGEVTMTPIEEIPDFDPADYLEIQGEEVHHIECTETAALADKAEHNAGREQPVGWPQDWDGEGVIPDPLCHPDYLEIGEWVHFEQFNASWEGDETSTLWRTYQTDDEVNAILWGQSQARADWTP